MLTDGHASSSACYGSGWGSYISLIVLVLAQTRREFFSDIRKKTLREVLHHPAKPFFEQSLVNFSELQSLLRGDPFRGSNSSQTCSYGEDLVSTVPISSKSCSQPKSRLQLIVSLTIRSAAENINMCTLPKHKKLSFSFRNRFSRAARKHSCLGSSKEGR